MDIIVNPKVFHLKDISVVDINLTIEYRHPVSCAIQARIGQGVGGIG